MKLRLSVVLSVLFAMVVGLGGCGPAGPETPVITNPYADVDWANFGRYKADFHTHTNQSDGNSPPAVVLDQYRAHGFKVLALTDHNKVTYPWSAYGRNPAELGMVAIRGSELSIHAHMNSLFNDTSLTLSERDALVDVGAKGGLIFFNHPYWTPDEATAKPPQWYLEFYRQYNHLIGMEVITPATWDYCLTQLMPDRPIWGFCNSDSHEGSMNSVWSLMLLPSLDEAQVRKALEQGRFYGCAPGKDAVPPTVQAIRVDSDRAVITVEGRDCARIIWIANGKQVHEGASLDCRTLPADTTYVRAELIGPRGGWARLNPFGIIRKATRRTHYPAQGQAYWMPMRQKLCKESLDRIRKNWNEPYPQAAKPGGRWRTLDLTGAANRPMTGPDGWLGKMLPGRLGSLYHVKPGRQNIQGVPFEVIDQGSSGGRSLICLRSKTFPASLGQANPDSVTIPIGARCDAVYVLHGAAYISEHEKIGQYRFAYADGTVESVDIVPLGRPDPAAKDRKERRARSNIQDWWPADEQFENADARKVIVADADNPLDIRYIYTLQWRNPHPQKEVKSVEFTSMPEGKAGLMIFAASARLAPEK